MRHARTRGRNRIRHRCSPSLQMGAPRWGGVSRRWA
jgi:hypothetical protein